MAHSGNLKVTGTVTQSLGSSRFSVELENKHSVLCVLSGKMRINFIKIIPGDTVELELSQYDLTKGRINKRLNNNRK